MNAEYTFNYMRTFAPYSKILTGVNFVHVNGAFLAFKLEGVIINKFSYFFNQNICCGYLKESHHCDGSFEHTKYKLRLSDKIIKEFAIKYLHFRSNLLMNL